MDNLLLKKEAIRIYNNIIKIKKTNKNLENTFNELLNDEYREYDMKILMYLTEILSENHYVIESTNPFKIIKK